MRSILTVTAAATVTKLTTLERLKLELKIGNNDNDAILKAKIDEASSDISAALGFMVQRETVSETFWFENGDTAPEYLLLDRVPVASIASVTVDGLAVDAAQYRVDDQTGQLYRLDASGYPCHWYFCKDIVVAYTGGFLLPGEAGRNLPFGIEGGCIDLVTGYWMSRGRDPLVKSEDIPGVMSTEYWVGSVGESGELPPNVMSKIAPYRRAVA